MTKQLAALWAGLAAIGSALILCAVAAGSPIGISIPLLLAAAAEIVWGVWVLRSGRVAATRSALIASAVVIAGVTVMLFVGLVGVLPFVAILALHWSTAILSVIAGRRPKRAPRNRPGLLVLGVTVQALLIAGITTPALADTEAGEHAVPHGTLHGVGHEHH